MSSVRRLGMWQSMQAVCGGVAAGGDLRSECGAVALAANGVVVSGGFGAMPDVVRIVAGGAFERAITFQKALRRAHPRDRAGGFEAAILFAVPALRRRRAQIDARGSPGR